MDLSRNTATLCREEISKEKGKMIKDVKYPLHPVGGEAKSRKSC